MDLFRGEKNKNNDNKRTSFQWSLSQMKFTGNFLLMTITDIFKREV